MKNTNKESWMAKKNKLTQNIFKTTMLLAIFVFVFAIVCVVCDVNSVSQFDNESLHNVANAISTSGTTTTVQNSDIGTNTLSFNCTNKTNWTFSLVSGTANQDPNNTNDKTYYWESQTISSGSNLQGTTATNRNGGTNSRTNFSQASDNGYGKKAPENMVGFHIQGDSNTCSCTTKMSRSITVESNIKYFTLEFFMFAATDGYDKDFQHYVHMSAQLYNGSNRVGTIVSCNADGTQHTIYYSTMNFTQTYFNSGATTYTLEISCDFYKKDGSGKNDYDDALALIGDIKVSFPQCLSNLSSSTEKTTNITSGSNGDIMDTWLYDTSFNSTNWTYSKTAGTGNTTYTDTDTKTYFYETQQFLRPQGSTKSRRYVIGGYEENTCTLFSNNGANEPFSGIHAQSDAETCDLTVTMSKNISIPSTVKSFSISFKMFSGTDGYHLEKSHYVNMSAQLYNGNTSIGTAQTCNASGSTSDPYTNAQIYSTTISSNSNYHSSSTTYTIKITCVFHKDDYWTLGNYNGDYADQIALVGPIKINVIGDYNISYATNPSSMLSTVEYVSGKKPTTMLYNTAYEVGAPKALGYRFTGWKVTNNLVTGTAKYGSTNDPTTSLTSSTNCYFRSNDAPTSVYFKNLSNILGKTVTLTSEFGINEFTIQYNSNGGDFIL